MRIADEIRSAVLSGEMRPGRRIRQELLGARFGASRIPVREALKQLENEGLVVLAPNRAYGYNGRKAGRGWHRYDKDGKRL